MQLTVDRCKNEPTYFYQKFRELEALIKLYEIRAQFRYPNTCVSPRISIPTTRFRVRKVRFVRHEEEEEDRWKEKKRSCEKLIVLSSCRNTMMQRDLSNYVRVSI